MNLPVMFATYTQIRSAFYPIVNSTSASFKAGKVCLDASYRTHGRLGFLSGVVL
jgi:hypothetical protein